MIARWNSSGRESRDMIPRTRRGKRSLKCLDASEDGEEDAITIWQSVLHHRLHILEYQEGSTSTRICRWLS